MVFSGANTRVTIVPILAGSGCHGTTGRMAARPCGSRAVQFGRGKRYGAVGLCRRPLSLSTQTELASRRSVCPGKRGAKSEPRRNRRALSEWLGNQLMSCSENSGHLPRACGLTCKSKGTAFAHLPGSAEIFERHRGRIDLDLTAGFSLPGRLVGSRTHDGILP